MSGNSNTDKCHYSCLLIARAADNREFRESKDPIYRAFIPDHVMSKPAFERCIVDCTHKIEDKTPPAYPEYIECMNKIPTSQPIQQIVERAVNCSQKYHIN